MTKTREQNRTHLLSRRAGAPVLFLALFLAATLSHASAEGLVGLEGGEPPQAELNEGDTIIVVWASWSPRSRNIGERVAAIEERWGERARVVTVNFQEKPETARAFARKQELATPVYLDRNAVFAKRHAVTSLPFLLVLSTGEAAFAGKLPADADAVIERALK